MTDERLSTAVHSARPVARARDRRVAFAGLVSVVSRALARSRGVGFLRAVFEDELRRLVPVRDVRLRDMAPAAGRLTGAVHGPDVVNVDVAGPDALHVATLEATLHAGAKLDAYDLQLLDLAAAVAALVLEIERGRAVARPTLALVRHREVMAPLVGSSEAMRSLRERMERIAATDFTVLIEGESGTGKELVARQIHGLSSRRHGPFVAINCAALVETLLEAELFGIEERTATGVKGRRGKFEHADGGTLFLDEVSDLSISAQAKLLRAIQDLAVERVGGQGSKRVNIRIVAATNRSLAGMVDRGLFRSDLFYRLSGVELHVPALRQRRDDILELARHFLSQHRDARRLELSPAAGDALLNYDWPGNVRELQRVMESTVALAGSDRIELDDLPSVLRGRYADILMPSVVQDDTMRAWGSRYARLILERSGFNKRRACRALGISYHTLQAYLRYKPRADRESAADSSGESRC
jgi:transcriptional regulator with PAS, ATPase and Fis domain